MKKTNVKHHVRRTKKKVVPVRKHSRKLKNRASRYFREEYLPSKGVLFDNVSKREKKIIGETIRKNPEFLDMKGDYTIRILTKDGPDSSKGAISVDEVDEKPIEEIGIPFYLNPEQFKQSNEDTFYERAIPDLKEGRISEDYFNKYKKESKYNLPKTMAHEFRHIGQIRKEGSGIDFLKKYEEDPTIFEQDARSFAEEFVKKKRKDEKN